MEDTDKQTIATETPQEECLIVNQDNKLTKAIESVNIEFKPGEKALIATVCTSRVDRDYEVIMPKGVKLDNYRKNPVVLLNHDMDKVIAKSEWIKYDKATDSIISKTVFANTYLGQECFYLYQEKFLNTFSVTVATTKYRTPTQKEIGNNPEMVNCSRVYDESELFEYSCVTIPSNKDALVIAVSKGLIKEPKAYGLEEVIKQKNIQRVSNKTIVRVNRTITKPERTVKKIINQSDLYKL